MKLQSVVMSSLLCLGGFLTVLAIAAPTFAKPIQPSQDPEQPGKIIKTPKDNTQTIKKLNNAVKSSVKYSVVKACNQGEFLFLKESTKKSGSPYWQVRLSDGNAVSKDILVATDARFSVVQNQTKGLAPVVLSEIRSYPSKVLMEMDLKNMVCK
jgi:hypothetical protein